MDVQVIKAEILSTMTSFVNEIELVFDYINNDCINKLRDLLIQLNKDDNVLLDFAKTTYNSLQEYETDLSYIIIGKHKIKSSDYNFLDNLNLFQNILNFNVFQNENKNTKKTIVNYLYNLYMSCFILTFGITNTENNEEFGKHLMSFVEKLQNVSQVKPTNNSNVKSKTQSKKSRQANPMSSLPDLSALSNLSGLGNLGGLDNIVKSLMSNNQLMSIANDLTQDIENQQIDPMTLLSSMMSGKPNAQVQKLVSSVTEKIENKINSGEIDKTMLEIQAKNILGSMGNLDNKETESKK